MNLPFVQGVVGNIFCSVYGMYRPLKLRVSTAVKSHLVFWNGK